MSDQPHSIFRLLQEDSRYTLEAYQFVREALSFGQNMPEMGEGQRSEGDDPQTGSGSPKQGEWELPEGESEAPEDWEQATERHLTGQQLCEAIRQYALEQYGYMAKVVLNNWGVRSTGDFGEIVYNLIGIGMMKKSKTDSREDFEDVYDFDDAFQRQFQITMPE